MVKDTLIKQYLTPDLGHDTYSQLSDDVKGDDWDHAHTEDSTKWP